MNVLIEAETEPYDQVVFINCLNTTDDYVWLDDMHPGKRAFRELARLFAHEILD